MIRPGSLLAVTGGTGFIGRRFVAEALGAGYRVRLLARHTPATSGSIEHRPFDLGDPEPLSPSVLEGCEAVVHIAGRIPQDHSQMAEAEACWRVNAFGTLRLLTGASAAGVRRFVQLTSANAYAPSLETASERSPLFPTSRVFYLGSKIMQEFYADAFCAEHAIDLSTLRLGSVYGPGQPEGTVSRLARTLRRGEAVRLKANGVFGADFVTVGDVASALSIVLRTGATGPINVGSGARSTIATIAEKLADRLGAGSGWLVYEPAVGEPDLGFPILDVSKLRALGYHPTDLDEGLRELVCWLRNGAPAL